MPNMKTIALAFSRRPGLGAWMVLACALFFLSSTAGEAQAQAGGLPRIGAVEVEGAQRIDRTTVLSYLTVAPGDLVSNDQLDESLKALFGTGLFADVSLEVVGDVLRVTVVENPIINRIAFEGNDEIEDEQLSAEVQLRPRVVYTRARVQADVDRILEIYRRNGRFSATVEPKIILLDQNRLDLVFEIEEGPRTKVRRITFIGNEAFSEGRLRGEIQTKEAAWYRILAINDSYDPDRLAFDRELLRRFYLARGYADFRVVSSVAELSPDREDFFITFTLEEGPRYRFGEIKLETQIRNLDAEVLRPQLTTVEGDTYNADEIEESIDQLTEELGTRQFAFVDIRPRVDRDRENLLINLVYQINEGPRVFVERIDIHGNVRTVDEVIRREFLVAEGDPFNTARLRRSEQRIRDLGFFERVTVNIEQGSEPDLSVIDVEVVEQSTGELSIGAGFSTQDGPLADLRIRERNLLGEGKDLSLATTISGDRQEIDLSFTEPYFLGRDLAAGIDLFRVTRDFQDESSFDQATTGFGFRLGYPLSENLRQRLSYTFENNEIENVGVGASRFIQEQEGQRITSAIGQLLTYDRRDSRLEPTSGFVVRLNTDLAGLGGDARYIRNRLGGAYYHSVLENVVLSLSSEIGYIVGFGQDVEISDRFFIGGDTLRGFEVAGIGPRDLATDDALGGNRFARASAEASFPIGLPNEFGIKGHLFSDLGTLGDVDDDGAEVVDTEALRASVGAGISWRSPLGPLRVDLAYPVAEEEFDDTELFRFSFGTRF